MRVELSSSKQKQSPTQTLLCITF